MGIWKPGEIGVSYHPDITAVDGTAQEWMFVDFSVPWDRNMVTKEDEKITNYSRC